MRVPTKTEATTKKAKLSNRLKKGKSLAKIPTNTKNNLEYLLIHITTEISSGKLTIPTN